MAIAATMRRCEITGLLINRSAEWLIMLNAVTAVVYLTIGGVLALLITFDAMVGCASFCFAMIL